MTVQPKQKNINKKIYNMRKKLIEEFNKTGSFKAENVYTISKKLDKEILKYMKQNHQNND